MRDKINKVIAKMTPAQKLSLLSMPLDAPFVPSQYAKQRTTAMCLKDLQLIRPVRTDDLGPHAMSVISPLGKGVRNILETGK